ncbi:MAG: hypothetical protein NT141_04470 [candidate division WWE3 bacterium]|nr:hypothetical protein [candidate division WWE3 bacterium]
MTATNQKESPPDTGFIYSLMWWKLDPKEVEKQVSNYATTPFIKTFRGVAGLLLLLSAAVTAAFVLTGIVSAASWLDCAIILFLALFIFLGFRWAMVLGMVVVTIERGGGILIGLLTDISHPNIIQIGIALLWWAVLMRFLYAAFRVERLRPPKPHLSEPTPPIASNEAIKTKVNSIALTLKSKVPTKILLVAIPALLLGLGFYWFNLRPSQIRRDCSVVKQEVSIIEAKLVNNQYISLAYEACVQNNNRLIRTLNLPKNAIPTTECWREAKSEEYTACLHSNGL